MKSLEEYIFLESIKVVNGSAFKEKASLDMSAWNDWKETAAKEHEDYVVYEDKVYAIMKSYTDLSNASTLFICVESVVGCDNKKIFNNLDHSSIIVDRTKESDKDVPKDAGN